MKAPSLKVQKRTITGRKVKTLRQQGTLPANIYGKNVKSLAVELSLKDFHQIYREVGETNLINLQIDQETKPRPALISNLQLHPLSHLPIHVDFHQVDLKEKVTADIPVEIVGESPAVKEKGAVLITLFDEIEAEALPTDLPDKFVLDISKLANYNAALKVKDLTVDPKKVTVKLSPEQNIVMVQAPQAEEEKPVEAAPPEAAEAPAEEPVEEKETDQPEAKPEEKQKPQK